MTDIWTKALAGLKPRLGHETYELWLRPLSLLSVDGTTVRLRAPSHFMKEWFVNHYRGAVVEQMRAESDTDYVIDIEVEADAEGDAEPSLAADTEAGQPLPPARTRATPRTEAADDAQEPPAAPLRPGRSSSSLPPPPSGLSPRYRFDSFIKGASNELAASAANAVGEEPGQRFNPLLIYGGVGLGKTHLLHAVGHRLHATRPELRIVYLSAERFMNEFITAVRYNKFDQFRRHYRDEPDVLLIDDIQFIAGRDRTMDEFFHVFNALYEAGKQIMVTADRTPSQMQGMEERLTSRLNWGLVADIKAPDLETRVAILRQKAEHDDIAIPDGVCVNLATLVRSNVRELEGALVRVATFAALKGVPITEDFVHEVLGEAQHKKAAAPITVEAVQKAVASHFAVRIADLKGPRRHKGIARPRMIAMFLCRELTGSSFPEIGLRFGGKDHSTVINACKRMISISADDPQLHATIEQLRDQLTGARAS
jgi:chromosomal replication initiator protein